jgi:hypothetical protein
VLASVLQTDALGNDLDSIFFVVIIVILLVIFARSLSSGNREVQPPMSGAASSPPPPPPEMVKCEYCGTRQVWKETCTKCGAALPKLGPGGA